MDPATTRLYLCRHGAVAAPFAGRLYGDRDVPLSDAGRAEAAACARALAALPLAAVVSSGLARAEDGAALIRAGRGLARCDEPSLKELSRGAWAGLSFAELDARSPGAFARWQSAPAAERPPGGESLADLWRRVHPTLARLAAEHAGQAVAVVAHSWVVRCAACHALGLGLEATLALALPTGALVVLDWPAAGESERRRPTLAGFAVDRAPEPGTRWFRGPHRG